MEKHNSKFEVGKYYKYTESGVAFFVRGLLDDLKGEDKENMPLVCKVHTTDFVIIEVEDFQASGCEEITKEEYNEIYREHMNNG